MFGFKIVRISKLETEELKLYNDTVEQFVHILSRLQETIEDIDPGIVYDEKALNQFMFDLNELCAIFLIYKERLYSPIGEVLELENELSELVKAASVFVTSADKYQTMQKQLDDRPEYDDEKKQKMYDYFSDRLASQIKEAITECCQSTLVMQYNIATMRRVIQYDVLRIALGVDLIREYHNNKRTKLPIWKTAYEAKFSRSDTRLKKIYAKERE